MLRGMMCAHHASLVFVVNYQLIVVGGGEVGVSIGNEEQLAVGVDGEKTQEVVLSAPHEVSHGLGLRLGHGFGPTVDV